MLVRSTLSTSALLLTLAGSFCISPTSHDHTPARFAATFYMITLQPSTTATYCDVAFDPIFYLHHTNVDRLLTIWARLNSETWVSRAGKSEGGGYSRQGTWTVPKGMWADSRTGAFFHNF